MSDGFRAIPQQRFRVLPYPGQALLLPSYVSIKEVIGSAGAGIVHVRKITGPYKDMEIDVSDRNGEFGFIVFTYS